MEITNLNGRKFYKIHSAYISRFMCERKFRYQERFLYSNGYFDRHTAESKKEKDVRKRYKTPEYVVFELKDNKLVEIHSQIAIVPNSLRAEGEGIFFIEVPDHPIHQSTTIVSEILTPEEFNDCFKGLTEDEIGADALLFQKFAGLSVSAKKVYQSEILLKNKKDMTLAKRKTNDIYCHSNRSK